MTEPQFDALIRLTRRQASAPSIQAARLVLCSGLRQADAARQVGCSRQALSNALARLNRALELARLVA